MKQEGVVSVHAKVPWANEQASLPQLRDTAGLPKWPALKIMPRQLILKHR